jgi:hypothetical protein
MSHNDNFHNKQDVAVNELNDADMQEVNVIIDKLKSLPSQTNPEGKGLIASLETWIQKMNNKYKEAHVNVGDKVESNKNVSVDKLGRATPKK